MYTYVVEGKGRLGKSEARMEEKGRLKRINCEAGEATCKQVGEYR